MGKPFGGMNQTGGGGAGGSSANRGFENFLAGGINQGVFGGGNFGGAIDSMLQGRIGDPNSLQQYFNAAQQGGGANINSVGGDYNAPGFMNPNLNSISQANGEYNAPNWLSSALGGMQFADPNQFGANSSSLNSGFGSTAQLGSAGSANVDGEFGGAVRQILGREQEKQVGDLRARYGASGSGLGSNAQYAESNFRAENTPQIAAALGQINQQERGLNLQQRGQDLQNFQGGRQLDISQLGAMNQAGGLGLQAFGMNNDAQLGMNNQMLQQGLAQNQFNQGNSQFGAQQGLQAQGMNMNSLMQQNQLNSQNSQFQNQFNQGNSQFGANFGQNAQQMNNQNSMQNQGLINQNAGMMGQLGLGMQGNQLQAQQGAMNAFMQMMMQNQGLNTAQRQNYYQPGWVQQGLGAANSAASLFQKANPFGGGGGGGNAAQAAQIGGAMAGMPMPGMQMTPQYNPQGSYGFNPGWQMPNLPVSYGSR